MALNICCVENLGVLEGIKILCNHEYKLHFSPVLLFSLISSTFIDNSDNSERELFKIFGKLCLLIYFLLKRDV